MNTNMSLAAAFGVMALLGTGFLCFLAALVLLQSVIVKRRKRARVVLLVMLIIAGAYLAVLLIFSLAS